MFKRENLTFNLDNEVTWKYYSPVYAKLNAPPTNPLAVRQPFKAEVGVYFSVAKIVKHLKIPVKVQSLKFSNGTPVGQTGVFAGLILAPGPFV